MTQWELALGAAILFATATACIALYRERFDVALGAVIFIVTVFGGYVAIYFTWGKI